MLDDILMLIAWLGTVVGGVLLFGVILQDDTPTYIRVIAGMYLFGTAILYYLFQIKGYPQDNKKKK